MSLERLIIIAFMICIFGGIGLLGWHFTQGRRDDRICTSAEAQCGERPYAAAP